MYSERENKIKEKRQTGTHNYIRQKSHFNHLSQFSSKTSHSRRNFLLYTTENMLLNDNVITS